MSASSASIPIPHADTARLLTFVVKNMGYRIFLSGGAAATLHGSNRKVKDLDFRIVLTFSFLSPNGDLFLAELNKAVLYLDPENTLFKVNDRKTGRTIVCDSFMGVEASISNTMLPLYGELDRMQAGANVQPVEILGIDDIIFDKMISIMFRANEEKELVDLSDLLSLLMLSKRHPAYYVRHLFLRRGAAYAFSSKPADIERFETRTTGKSSDLNKIEKTTIDTEERKRLIKNPEQLMLGELLATLIELGGCPVLKKQGRKDMYEELVKVVQLAIKNPPPKLTLLEVTPQVALGTGVRASKSRDGYWEV